jgi:hypothetical protein
MTSGMIFIELATPTAERFAFQASNGIGELLIIAQGFFKFASESRDALLPRILIESKRIAEPASLSNFGIVEMSEIAIRARAATVDINLIIILSPMRNRSYLAHAEPSSRCRLIQS